MSNRVPLEGRWVVVTGASSGLGREMALGLARDYSANVVVVARRRDRLDALAAEITTRFGRECVPVAADLAASDGPQRVFKEAIAGGRDVVGAILNAGITFSGNAVEQSEHDFTQMLATNVSSQVTLSHHFARHFATEKNRGAILIVSSLTSMAPFPYQATYAGTKAFLTTYGRSLSHEVRREGVSVTVFLPGGIATEMLDVSGMGKWKKGDIGIMDADECARAALAGFSRRKALVVPGLVNQMSALALKLAPHGLAMKVIAKIYNEGKRA